VAQDHEDEVGGWPPPRRGAPPVIASLPCQNELVKQA